jgi:hypothetical protein
MTLSCLFAPVTGTHVSVNTSDCLSDSATFLSQRIDGQRISSPFAGIVVSQQLTRGHRIGRTCFPDKCGRGSLLISILHLPSSAVVSLEIAFGSREGSRFLVLFNDEHTFVDAGQRLVSFGAYAYVTLFVRKNAFVFCPPGARVRRTQTFVARCK